MTRTTSVLSNQARLEDAWLDLPSSGLVSINAQLGRHYRIQLTQNAVLDPPWEPHPGQVILLRIEQDFTGGRTLTPNSLINTRGTRILNTASLAVTVWMLVYDDQARSWDLVGIPDLSTVYDVLGAATAAQAAAISAAAAAAALAYQPINTANLTPIAALTTVAYGRNFLEVANAADARTKLGLGTVSTKAIVAAQADSTAILLAGIVDDFNALLAKLRSSGVMAT